MTKLVENIAKEVVEQLGIHLDHYMPSLNQVLYDFPESNVVLKYPSLGITIKDSSHDNQMPYVFSQGDLPESGDKKTSVKYVVGEYVWKLQIDLWERTKEQRHDLYELFYEAFNKNLPQPGLFLTLKNYHNVNCNYAITGFRFEDSDISSQRKEWRAIIDVEANCQAVLTKEEFIITDTELTLTTPNNIPNE